MQKKATAPAPAKSADKSVNKASPAAAAAKHPAPAKAAAAAPKKSAPTAKPTPAKGSAAGTLSKSTATRPPQEVSKTVVAKKPAATKTAPKTKAKGDRAVFFAKQRDLLHEERMSYISSAEALKAQADSLALEHEPGDVQFDEEGGEGGTANVDREIDLYLSGQARATVVEIDRALQKIEDGTYGVCEHCGETIPDARLQALPYAALCVTCKSGGLSSRR